MKRVGLVGVLLLVGATSSCIPSALPLLPGSQLASGETRIEYFVDCGVCSVEYWTLSGPGRVDRVEGEFRRVESAAQPDSPLFVSLVAVPWGSDVIGSATIKVNGKVVDEGGRAVARAAAGGPVQLAACVGPGVSVAATLDACE